MDKPTYLTEEGLRKLKDELSELAGPKRTQLAQRLRAAIQMGDLSENADYSAAKEEQAFLEGRIQELTQLLGNVVIIEENNEASDLVEIGSNVTIQEEGEEEETYFLVGPQEADPAKGRISYSSPIGEALLGHKAGETVTAVTPAGQIRIKIITSQQEKSPQLAGIFDVFIWAIPRFQELIFQKSCSQAELPDRRPIQ
jgi:transcription elongation factor GreA